MNMMKTLMIAGAMAVGMAASANAAIYIKFDGVDGDVKAADWDGANTLWLTTDKDPQAIGLLLPAVQKVREAAPRSRSGGPHVRVFDGFEVTDTSAGMTYMLHDAKAAPAGENRVKITYRCKDWRNLSTGEKGSDCDGATRR